MTAAAEILTPDPEQSVTIVILTRDELGNVGRLARELGTSFPILCIDCGSRDGTPELVSTLPGWTLHTHPYLSYGAQLNWALENVLTTPWAFVLDADESLNFPVAALAALAERADVLGKHVVALRRKNYLGSYWLRYGGWWPDWQMRLMRSSIRYESQAVHSHALAQPDEIYFSDAHTLTHFSYRDVDHYLQKYGEYLLLESSLPRRLDSHRPRYRRVRNLAQVMPAASLARFFYVYVVRAGFRDGRLGFFLALLTAVKVYVSRHKKSLQEFAQRTSVDE